MLVRPYEYIVGRLNGKFLQSDPSLYRRNKKSQKNGLASIYYHEGYNNNIHGGVPDRVMQGSEYGNIRQHPAKSNTVKPQFYPYSDPPALIPHLENQLTLNRLILWKSCRKER
jgi:hypothetical protein